MLVQPIRLRQQWLHLGERLVGKTQTKRYVSANTLLGNYLHKTATT